MCILDSVDRSTGLPETNEATTKSTIPDRANPQSDRTEMMSTSTLIDQATLKGADIALIADATLEVQAPARYHPTARLRTATDAEELGMPIPHVAMTAKSCFLRQHIATGDIPTTPSIENMNIVLRNTRSPARIIVRTERNLPRRS